MKACLKLFGLISALSLAPLCGKAAPLASALGPEVPVAKAAATGFVGSLKVLPDHGPLGTPVSVTGRDFPPNQQLQLVWRTVKGSWNDKDGKYRGRNYKPVGYRIAAVWTNAHGTFSVRFKVPEDFGFLHDIDIQQGRRLLTQTGFYLNMEMTLSPKRAPLGAPITVDVTGIGWRNYRNSWMLVYDNSFTGWVSAVTTAGSAHVTIPATGAVGTHVIRLVHGAYTFPYLNPQQNPYPDRPRFRAEFQLIAGKTVLPAPSQKQILRHVRGLPPGGALSVSPPFGGIRTPITVVAHHLASYERYRLQWTTVVGSRVSDQGWITRSKPIAEAESNSQGNAIFRFRAPNDLGGDHQIWLRYSAKKETGNFWITPTALPLNINKGPAGTTFTVHLKGVGWSDTSNIYTVDYDNAYLGYACGFNSQGDVTIHLPASGAPGWHFIDLYPGIYRGKEKNPNNFRIPQLTYAADHPGENVPAFHFAFDVTKSGKASH